MEDKEYCKSCTVEKCPVERHWIKSDQNEDHEMHGKAFQNCPLIQYLKKHDDETILKTKTKKILDVISNDASFMLSTYLKDNDITDEYNSVRDWINEE